MKGDEVTEQTASTMYWNLINRKNFHEGKYLPQDLYAEIILP